MSISNLLRDQRPDLFEQLHPTKNKEAGIDVDRLTYGSRKKVWWYCSRNTCDHHIWEATVNDRAKQKGTGCPFCSRLKTCICDSIATTHPHLLNELVPHLNPGIDVTKLFSGSGVEAWWRCNVAPCGHHVWRTQVRHRTAGHGCPFCSRVNVCPCDSFASLYPEILPSFHETLNSGIDPYTLAPGSGFRYWWKCMVDGSHLPWMASIASRTGSKTNCPACNHSKLEKKFAELTERRRFLYEAQKTYADCINPETGTRLRFDGHVSSLDFHVELDGIQHFF